MPRRGQAWLVLVLLGGACATEDPGIAPARDRFYFPATVAVDPEWPVLYVANSNADLQFNGGTLNLLQLDRLPADLSRIGEAVKSGTLSCRADPFDPTIWECPEEQFINGAATIRIGDFPSDMRVSRAALGEQKRERRVFVPVRGANQLLWAEVVRWPVGGGGFAYDLRCTTSTVGSCAPGAAGDCEVWDCDEVHLVSYSSDRRKQLPSEPFGLEYNPLTAVHLDAEGGRRTCLDGLLPEVSCDCGEARLCAGEADIDCCTPPPRLGTAAGPAGTEQRVVDHLYVTHLLGGEVSFFTSGPDGVQLRDTRGGFFTASGDIRGAFAVATRRPGDPSSLSYVSSRVDANLASFLIQEDRRILDATRAALAGAIAPGNDVRGLAFGPGGNRLYAVSRLPSSLVALDMSPREPGGLPRQEPLWATPVCGEPSVLRLGPDPLRPELGPAGLAYVVCFGAGQIYVVETEHGQVVGQIVTGKGPNGLAIDTARRRAFVANFLDNTIGVIDLDPGHPSYHRMVLRIGRNEYLVRATQ
jgi:DNA-binding beta-propeller fold protein YncE